MICILDGSNFVYRAVALPTLEHQGQRTDVAYGFIRMLLSIQKKFMFSKYYVCWDTGVSTFRRAIYKDYKRNWEKEIEKQANLRDDLIQQIQVTSDETKHAQLKDELSKVESRITQMLQEREQKREIFKQAEEKCRPLVMMLGMVNVSLPQTEGDDLVAALCLLLKDQHKCIVSTDKDLLQLVDEKTMVYDPVRNRVIDANGADQLLPVQLSKYVHYKVLVGDPGDNIIGVKGIGEVRAKHLLSKYDLDDILQLKVDEEDKKLAQMVVREREKVMNNLKLMDLRKIPAELVDDVRQFLNIPSGVVNFSGLDELIRRWGFKNICLSDFEVFYSEDMNGVFSVQSHEHTEFNNREECENKKGEEEVI